MNATNEQPSGNFVPKLTPSQRQQIVNRVIAGEAQMDVAAEFKVHPSTVCRLVAAARRPPAKPDPHEETLALAQQVLDTLLIESNSDPVVAALCTVKKNMIAVQIERAQKGDTKAVAFVLKWLDQVIEQHRRRKAAEPAPENAAFVPWENSAPFIRQSRHDDDDSASALPVEPAPRERREAPEPVEEKATVSFDPPRRERTVRSLGPDRVRRNGNTYRHIAHFSREEELLRNL